MALRKQAYHHSRQGTRQLLTHCYHCTGFIIYIVGALG